MMKLLVIFGCTGALFVPLPNFDVGVSSCDVYFRGARFSLSTQTDYTDRSFLLSFFFSFSDETIK